MLRSSEPLAVTGENDEFLGLLSRSKVVDLVSPLIDAVEESPDAAAESTPDDTAKIVEAIEGSKPAA